MALSAADREVVEHMKQRELHLKQRHRATDAILYRERRYRQVLSALIATGFALLVAGIAALIAVLDPAPTRWYLIWPSIGIGAFFGVVLGQSMWQTALGRSLLAAKESRLRREHGKDLNAGRRWLQFYYQGEEISAYVPQVLYFIESEGRFDSVADALLFAKERARPEGQVFAAHALERFNEVAEQTNVVVIASADHTGQPSSRIMRFVRTDRPGVWYVTTAPQSPKVHELDLGRVAVVTRPTESGANISSNRVDVRRAGAIFPQVADLYRAQVPGYLDSMSDDEQAVELVYELTLRSAKVDSWQDRVVVDFDGADLD